MIYEAREKVFGERIMRELEHVILLKNVDILWMDHIDAMEELKRGIGLRAYAQHDPVVEYRLEGFEMFDEMIATIRENTARMMLTVPDSPSGRAQAGRSGKAYCYQRRRNRHQASCPEQRQKARQKRSLSLRQRFEVQEVLRQKTNKRKKKRGCPVQPLFCLPEIGR